MLTQKNLSKAGAQTIVGSAYTLPFLLMLNQLIEEREGPIFIIAPDALHATRLQREYPFLQTTHTPLMSFPDWEVLPYDHFSPHKDIIADRLQTLSLLPSFKKGALVAPVSSVMQRLPPPSFLQTQAFHLKVGQHFDRQEMTKTLSNLGYHSVKQVMESGEFAIRGSIFDLFLSNEKYPYRIDLFDDEIDSIRIFSPETQRSIENMTEIKGLSAKEFPFDKEGINQFKTQWFECFPRDEGDCSIYREVIKGIMPAGIEFYSPLFFQETATIFDYLPSNTLIIQLASLSEKAEQYWQHINDRYEQYGHDLMRPILPTRHLWLIPSELFEKINAYPKIKAQVQAVKNDVSHVDLQAEPLPDLSIDANKKEPLVNLKKYIETHQYRLVITVESSGRLEVMQALFHKHGVFAKHFQALEDFFHHDEFLGICVANLDEGVVLKDKKIAIVTEAQLYDKKVLQRRRRKQKGAATNTDLMVKSIAELEINDSVVHLDHGVGKFLGLQTLSIGDHQAEYLTLSYQNNDKLYVPINALHLIHRYSTAESAHSPLHKLGNDRWERAKTKAAKRIFDVAAELLAIYAKRALSKTVSYTVDESEYSQFAEQFPFEETPDQQQAIDCVLKDLQSPSPTDRLICGDVGFGKTEVAMRAAFVTVSNNFQVAILAPTTLLVEQHSHNFMDRFSSCPFKIASLSRFKTLSEQKEIIGEAKLGKIDILIGTHALLGKSIEFKNLGLLIIDEEHRFGVRQKEQIKSLRSEVNIITLTATPIPRTLNLALSSIRDLSIISTPPPKRLGIKTFVHLKTNSIMKEALSREILRGGQIFYLHNNVQTIDSAAREIESLMPDATVAVAHGQMSEKKLERIMSDFYHQRFTILVCTTIIETGIDIPTANTIIINRADKLGLAQLHQLRGRVGRSHHQAYAYLFVPEETCLSKDAKKRLEAITQSSELGAGFMLASHDLEIRGAGELLGDEQSGQMNEIGYSLYMELLQRTVEDLRKGKKPTMDFKRQRGVEIDLHVTALIPEDYILDVHTRLQFYKKISHTHSPEELDDLKIELIDRFGPLPHQGQALFDSTALRFECEKLGIYKLNANAASGKLEFSTKTTISPDTIIRLIQTKPATFKLSGSSTLHFTLKKHSPENRISLVENTLAMLS
jgi:transcription-repair coupling factor (superfamily II helicase)